MTSKDACAVIHDTFVRGRSQFSSRRNLEVHLFDTMNRSRQGRDRGNRNYGGGGDGLLGEGPSMGSGLFEPMVNPQVNQLLIAQQLLQQQAALGGVSGYGGDYGGLGDIGGLGGGMNYPYQGMGYGLHNDRKRSGGQSRDSDYKRRRRDSSGRSDRDRSRGRDSNRSGEGKDKNRSNRWESDKDQEGEKGEADYDPAEPTEDDERKDKDSNLYCHVCNVSVYDDESFRRHLNGMKHTQRMNSLLTVHEMKSNQLRSRIKAEEHLRKIEGKNASSGADPEYFCKICNNSLNIPWERHRFSNIHKQRQLQVKRGCGWCKVHDFNNFTEVLEHRETEEHKKNAEIYGKKRDDSGDRSRSRSRDRGKYRSYRRSSSRDRSRRDKDQDDSDNEDLTIPEFNAENPVGVKYIIPVTGYFCKLCHKFYNNEKSAKGSHCQSETHYEKFKIATEEKIAAREKRLAEKAAAEAEALKAKEEEAKAKEETEDQEMGDTEAANNKQHDDGHDYNDELPLEDVDNEGGLTKEGDYSLGYDDTAEQSHNETVDNYETADSSYGYLPEDPSQGEYKAFPAESYAAQDPVEVNTDNPDDAIMDVSAATVRDEEESEEEATPTVTPKKGRGATARRGRGRGKARK